MIVPIRHIEPQGRVVVDTFFRFSKDSASSGVCVCVCVLLPRQIVFPCGYGCWRHWYRPKSAKCPRANLLRSSTAYEAGALLCLAPFVQPCRGDSPWRAQSSALPDVGQGSRLAGSKTHGTFFTFTFWLCCICLS